MAKRNEDDLINTPEAAAIVGLAAITMERMRWRGDGPPWYRIGAKLIRYKRAEVIAYKKKITTSKKQKRKQ